MDLIDCLDTVDTDEAFLDTLVDCLLGMLETFDVFLDIVEIVDIFLSPCTGQLLWVLCLEVLGGFAATISRDCLELVRHETVQRVTEAWVRVTTMVRTKAMIRTGYRTLSRLRLSTVRHPSVKIMSGKVLAKSDERVAMAC